MHDCRRCGEPVAEGAEACPHCGAPVPAGRTPAWFGIIVAAGAVGVASWLYELVSNNRIGILGALAGAALYAGVVWMLTGVIFGGRLR